MRNAMAGLAVIAAIALSGGPVAATVTENLGIRILPVPGKVAIDGKFGDWDLSYGVFVCGDVATQRETLAVWLHMMYDAENLYVLARWIDHTPMNNPGQLSGPSGRAGDSLRMSFFTVSARAGRRASHWTCWAGTGGKDVIRASGIGDARKRGAGQAFSKNPDGKGYVQEVAIPWKLLFEDGKAPKAGAEFALTVAPRFTVGGGVLAVKDIWRPGITPNRTFTGGAINCWGPATLERKGGLTPRPVRLSDGREFPVRMKKGLPVVDWSGLIAREDLIGFKTIRFTMPGDGYVSMNIRDANGVVVRQLLSAAFYTKGPHEVKWDGLTTSMWKDPGQPVSPGDYKWSAIWHKGIGLRFGGWTYHGPSDPWDNAPKNYWGGDHALPTAAAADDKQVYLGWGGAEAGKALIACGLDDNVVWAAGYHFNGCSQVTADRGRVYYLRGDKLRLVDANDGRPVNWPGKKTASVPVKDMWGGGVDGMPGDLSWTRGGILAHGGMLYVSFSQWDFQPHDIRSWYNFLSGVRADATGKPEPDMEPSAKAGLALSKAIWAKISYKDRYAIKKWLSSYMPDTSVPKAIPPILKILNRVLADRTLVKGGDKLTSGKLAEANRRLMERTYSDAFAPAQRNFIAVIDPNTCKMVKRYPIDAPSRMAPAGEKALYVLSDRSKVLVLDLKTGKSRVVVEGLTNCHVMTADRKGSIYVAVGGPDHQIHAFSPSGKRLYTMGKKGGRILRGPWDPDRLFHVWGMAVDAKGTLWAAETDVLPKRISLWDTKTGKFIKEYFGATHYGASGGAINPHDPNILVGEGCEFRIDPKTGRGKLLGIVSPDVYNGVARFCEGANGKLYFAGAYKGRVWGKPEPRQIRIYQRLGDGDYAYRAVIRSDTKADKTFFWADANGDGNEQPGEVTSLPMAVTLGGHAGFWAMNMNTDLTLYPVHKGQGMQIKVSGFTACDAPKYDLKNIKELPRLVMPLPSPDNRLVASFERTVKCYEVAGGKLLWTYPNEFSGVHGSHYAPGPAPGLMRGTFVFIGNGKLPDPIGEIWALNSNVGEWHVLTGEGFYLTRLFQGDPTKIRWPEEAAVGAVLDNVPPGHGGEDFGGNFTQAKDGSIYIQAGKTSLWKVKVVGLETVKRLGTGAIRIAESEVAVARRMRAEQVQAAVGIRQLTISKAKPRFTGNIVADFGRGHVIVYGKQSGAGVRSAAAWDDDCLYLGWEVKDTTPWINGARTPEQMYVGGDTVDFQLATDPGADKTRAKAGPGDLRLSIGNFKGKHTAVIYRRVSGEKKPKLFSSGVIKNYRMDYVSVVEGVKIKMLKGRRDWGYVVEAAVPWGALGVRPTHGMKLRADFGATHGAAEGQRTRLRTYWNNQHTGTVDDEVFELKMEPKNWGQLNFRE